MSSVGPDQLTDREHELSEIHAFLDEVRSGLSALIFEGQPGIGRTSLWRAGIAMARDAGCRLLVARPAEAEAALSFSVLGDLLREMLAEEPEDLPSPQRHALEAALLLSEPEESAPNALAVSLAVHGVLRLLAQQGPLIIAIDDIQWTDPPSARALQFALRRSENEPIGMLVSSLRGAERLIALESVVPTGRIRSVALAPLAVEDLGEVLSLALRHRHPRHVVARVHSASGGNPMYAIEIARALRASGQEPEPGTPLPVPDNLRGALRGRLEALDARTREALLVVALLAEPDEAAVVRALGSKVEARAALDQGERAGLLEVEGGRVRLAHPLLGSVLYADASEERRRDVHRRLADVTDDQEERARHFAAAVSEPDVEVAAVLEQAARRARARGAPGASAELLEQAMALTPGDASAERRRRAIVAAECHLDAGSARRARALLEQVLESADPGPDRALALQRLGWVRYHEDSWSQAARLFGEALEHAGDDPKLAAAVELDTSMACLFSGDLTAAEDHSRRALDRARALGDRTLLGEAMAMAASIGFLMGQGVGEEDLEEALSMESWEESRPTPVHPGVAFGLVLKWSDDLARARSRLEDAHTRALEEGNERSLPFLLFHLAELECWTGNWQLAERYADEGCAVATETGQESSLAFALYSKALLEAHRGEVEAARATTERGLALAELSGALPVRVLLLSVLGFVEVSLGEYGAAHRYLGPLAEAAREAGIREPGVLRYVPDGIEDLISIGDLEGARTLLDLWEERSEALGRVWGLAVGARCRGLLLSSAGDHAGAIRALERAVSLDRRLGQPFELARTLLALGTVRRRAQQRRAARETLEEALETFQRLGASLWIERARSELGRIGGRAPSSVELTPTEERVARLVADGKSNREVAGALFLTVRTVEWNLGRIYRKLGVRSRTELARWFLDRDPSSS